MNSIVKMANRNIYRDSSSKKIEKLFYSSSGQINNNNKTAEN